MLRVYVILKMTLSSHKIWKIMYHYFRNKLSATEYRKRYAKVLESILFLIKQSKFSFGNLKLEISKLKMYHVLAALLKLIVNSYSKSFIPRINSSEIPGLGWHYIRQLVTQNDTRIIFYQFKNKYILWSNVIFFIKRFLQADLA